MDGHGRFLEERTVSQRGEASIIRVGHQRIKLNEQARYDRGMSFLSAALVARVAAAALALEVFINVPWIGRILSMGVVYDGPVFAVVAVRAAVTALQTSAAWLLWQGLPAGPRFGQVAFVASAAVLVLEIGLRLAPSSLQPGLRWPLVGAYALYAFLAVLMLRERRVGSGSVRH
jgi:hypothetical protein